MSRYQQANQYSDAGGSYGNDNGYNGGYTDNPDGNGGYGDGGYGKYGGNGANEYPMSSSNPYASAASPGGYTPKKKRSKWLTIGLPIILLIIIGAVLGGVLGTQLNKNKDGNSSNSGSSGAQQGVSEGGVVVPSGVSNINTAQATNTAANRYLAVQTDTYMLPVYATPTATAGYAAPSSGGSGNSWPSDPDSPSSSSPRSHPRLIAPQYKWDALKANLVSENPYFTFWNDTIMSNAEANYSLPLTPRVIDGGSGMLDVSRQIKEKVKNWSYAWKMTGDTKWADRVYRELNYAAGNDPDNAFGPANNTRWYPEHFLDVAEMASAFAIGYDWVYDHWTDDQRSMLRTAMIDNALELGQQALQGQGSNNWWANTNNGAPVAGNWNCVINAGLTMAALAIQGDDTSGIADSVIGLTVPNAQANCFLGPSSDGSWNEGPNYWYFGTTGMGEMCSALTSAHGSDSGLATSQGGIALTSLYHMYVQGMTSLFNYGDHGPNKFSSTANSLLYWSTVFNEPRYALYQRDRYDAHEPFAMFWYDPAVSGTWWDDLPLDRHFNSTTDEWATGRSSWTDNDGTYWAMKGGRIPDHQNHLDMDLGDFVVDAMGQRWFGELGSGQYLALDYFTGDNQQEGGRWAYYRKRTEGQNTIQINEGNQLISATPEATFQSTGTSQGASPSFNVSETDSAFFTLDLSSAYGNGASVHRGIRFLNSRKQFLIQDDFDGVASGSTIEWRAHTNATVETNGATATLVLDSATMIAEILNAPSGVSFSTALPTRQAGGPPPVPQGQGDNIDLPNPNITVLVIQREADGQPWSNQVLLSPQWSGMAAEAYQTPSATAVTSWSL